jgi:hypothetical protein
MRTAIMADRNTTIDPHDLERFGTITLVGLPSSAAKKRPQLGQNNRRIEASRCAFDPFR